MLAAQTRQNKILLQSISCFHAQFVSSLKIKAACFSAQSNEHSGQTPTK